MSPKGDIRGLPGGRVLAPSPVKGLCLYENCTYENIYYSLEVLKGIVKFKNINKKIREKLG